MAVASARTRSSLRRLDRNVALKVLAPAIASDPAARGRFEREARAVAALDHPRISGTFDVGECAGTPFFVMPLLDGPTRAARFACGTRSCAGDGAYFN